MGEPTDFIATELLKELKESNARKDAQIVQQNKDFKHTICAFIIAILIIVVAFLLYLNQYDFSGTTTSTIMNTAEGVYAIVDSEGNVIASDLTPEEIERIVTIYGKNNQESHNTDNQNED